MKSLVTYYSFSGNTDKVAGIFADLLRGKGEVELQRLEIKDEIKDFAGQCRAAFTKKRACLQADVKSDVCAYDLVLIGSPVWAFAPTPALNTYLDKIAGIDGKKIVIFLTSGSGLGVKRCFKNIRAALENKGMAQIEEINIPDRMQGDADFIKSSLQKIL